MKLYLIMSLANILIVLLYLMVLVVYIYRHVLKWVRGWFALNNP